VPRHSRADNSPCTRHTLPTGCGSAGPQSIGTERRGDKAERFVVTPCAYDGFIGTYNKAKFRELVLFAADLLQDHPSRGSTKLHKLLFFSEFSHFRKYGEPIAGAEFVHRQRGPLAQQLLPTISDLLEDNSAVERAETVFGDEEKQLVPLRDPDMSLFSGPEAATVVNVARDLSGMTAAQVSELSHKEPGWLMTNEGDVIPYESALILTSPSRPTTASLKQAAEAAQRYGLSALA